ncbi:glycosyltransferase family A protein [Pedobacter cryoconitis]|uniref:Glycosyl transferase family 2 n=1 Tax=Pedobacter cryoconitis TaxID=188932 RepID=A0A327SJB0_9SPHI|nr:glycosyltransferase family A protein [Pedobacter cryoconitis]RAJ29089.1 hypothetical protein LY11_02981 [Pedobacter cryoconitis]
MRLVDDYRHYHFILWKKNEMITRYDMMVLSFEFLEQDFDYILCLKFDPPLDVFKPEMNKLTKSLEAFFDNDQNTFVILTQRKEAPLYQVSSDEFIYSFSCNFHHFKKIINTYNQIELLSRNLLFELLNYIGNGNSNLYRIIVRQIPFETIELSDVIHCDVVVPHRGEISYLRNLMVFLNKFKNVDVFIGIDQLTVGQELGFRHKYPNVSFYSFKSNPVGPYVIRNWLVNQGRAKFVFFQDSDDIPCADRFERLSAFMTKRNIPLCGSHEVKMDYFNRTIQAIRYPKDVINALENGPAHALLHPSSAIERNMFYYCNRLSEDKIFANDSKFLYYCYFKLNKIENIDEFLYIRRFHPDSLTTSPITYAGSPGRMYLINRWVVDFTLVKLGVLKLEDSCLNYTGPKRKFVVKKL